MDPHCRKPLSEACIIYKAHILAQSDFQTHSLRCYGTQWGWVRKHFSSCICLIKETYQGKKINLKTVDKCYCYKFRLGVINKMSTTQKLLFPAVDGMQNMP